MTQLSPPLKWAGGKRWLIPHLLPLWQPHNQRRLVEPFCGGLAIALGLRPDRALLNDVNPHLINFYQELRRGLYISSPMHNCEDWYYAARDQFNSLINNDWWQCKAAAEFFYYLNRTGFNGLCRFNSKGGYNVPFGKYKAINYLRNFTHYQPVLKPWRFTCGDFEKMAIAPNDFIYADPPYDTPFTQYSAGGFTWADQVRLAEWLAQHPVPVVASNAASRRILDLYQSHGFSVQTIEAPRRISCNGDRKPVLEMLAMKGVL